MAFAVPFAKPCPPSTMKSSPATEAFADTLAGRIGHVQPVLCKSLARRTGNHLFTMGVAIL